LRHIITVIVCFMLSVAPVAAGSSISASLHTVHAIEAKGKITLDGILDEETWAKAVPIGDFTQRNPDEGKEPTERTELRVAFDRSAVYFGVRMFDREPGKIVRRLSRRDV